eukprot:1900432-Amphidinium_carterae.1
MKTEMKAENSKFVGLCPTGSEKVIIGKDFALLDRILQEEGYPDAKVVHEAATGFDLVGFPEHVLDLSHAYKQFITLFHVHPWNLNCRAHGLQSTRGGGGVFLQRVLPFGSTSSVLAFNKLARALGFAGLRVYNEGHVGPILLGPYFNNFGMTERVPTSGSCWRSIECLLDVLGW